jgi:hypothetical protein
MSIKRPGTASQMRTEVAGLSSKAIELFATPLAAAVVSFCANAKHLRVAAPEGLGWTATGPSATAGGTFEATR